MRHLRCRAVAVAAVLSFSFSFLTNSACSSPLFNFSAPPPRKTDRDRPRSLPRSHSADDSLVSTPTEGGRDEGEGGIFPPTLIQLSPLAWTERESKCRFFCRRQSSGFLSSAKLASINGASGGRPVELTAAKVGGRSGGGHRSRSSINQSDSSFLPSLSHLSIGTKSIGGSVRSPKCSLGLCCSCWDASRISSMNSDYHLIK